MKQIKNGFTLLEIMVVVSIIGLLAAWAIPAYQDYSSKTQISLAYQEISSLKVPADLMLINNTGTTDAIDLGWIEGNSPLMINNPTVSIDPPTGNAYIEALLNGRVNSAALGVKVRVSRDSDGKWVCTVKRSGTGGWKDEFAPKACTVIP